MGLIASSYYGSDSCSYFGMIFPFLNLCAQYSVWDHHWKGCAKMSRRSKVEDRRSKEMTFNFMDFMTTAVAVHAFDYCSLMCPSMVERIYRLWKFCYFVPIDGMAV